MTRAKTIDALNILRDSGYTDTQILEYILFNHLPGITAQEAIYDAYEDLTGEAIPDESK